MPTPQLAMPPSRRTIHPKNVHQVERWAAAQRAQLAQLRLHLRSLRSEVDAIAGARIESVAARQEAERRFERELDLLKEELLTELGAVAAHANAALQAQGAATSLHVDDAVVAELRSGSLPGEPPPTGVDEAFARFWRDVDGDRPAPLHRARSAVSA